MTAFDSARHFDDRRAQVYDGLIRQVVPGYEVLHRLVAVLLGGELGGGAHLLIAGVGTGAEIANLASDRPGWRFTGFDLSADMLGAARRRVDAAGWGERVDLLRGGVDAVPDTAFDAATLVLVLHFLPDDGTKQAMLSGLAKRLKPGAPLVLADLHGARGTAEFDRLMATWRAWQLDAGIPEPDVDKGFAHIVKDIHFVPEERLAAMLETAGFGRPERFWGGLLFGGWVAYRQP